MSNTALALLSSLLLAASVSLFGPSGRRRSIPAPGSGAGGTAKRAFPPRLAAAVAAFGCWALIGGVPGLLVGIIVALGAPTLFSLLEPRAARQRRSELVRAAPVVADLIGSALTAGVPLDRVVPVVARAMGGTVAEVLGHLERRLALGADPPQAWLCLVGEPGFDSLGRAAARSARTGAPLADVLLHEGAALRAAATAHGLAAVRAAGVSAVLPLGLCLLPAFVLLVIVPVVAGMLADL